MAYTTTAIAKVYLGLTSAADDTLIGTLIVRAQAMIDSFCHRTFEASGDTTKYFDMRADTGEDRRRLYFSEGLELAQSPTTVTNGDTTVMTLNTDFVVLPANDAPFYGLELLWGGVMNWVQTSSGSSQRAISVLGRWAYSVSAPGDIVAATIRLVAFLYRQRETSADFDRPVSVADGVVLLPGRLPADLAAILLPYQRHGR